MAGGRACGVCRERARMYAAAQSRTPSRTPAPHPPDPVTVSVHDTLATPDLPDAPDPAAAAIAAAPDLATLLAVWRAHAEGDWQGRPAPYVVLAERLLRYGEPLLAYEVVGEGLCAAPAHRRLRQLQGLALARAGAPERAREVLTALADEAPTDGAATGGADAEETLGILARTYKDLALGAAAPEARASYLARAAALYERAFRLTGGGYGGVNAATVTLLLGDAPAARAIAAEVRAGCLARLGAPDAPADPYYELATLGEAALVLGDDAEARRWYGRAVAAAGGRYGDLASARRNARLVLGARGVDAAFADEVLPVPPVLLFVGPDPDAPVAGPEQEAAGGPAAAAIAARVGALAPGDGFATPRGGVALDFLAAVAASGGSTHLVLPYDRDQFVADAVGDDVAWRARFDAAEAGAAEVVTATGERFVRERVLQDYADALLLGLARVRARERDAELVCLTVDGGAVRDAAPAALGAGAEGAPAADAAAADADGPRAAIKSHLFADVVHSSALTEGQQYAFVARFLGAIAALVRRSAHAPMMKNTWGDGLYFVFDRARDAGLFALELRELVETTDWAALGLRAGLTLRIAVHSGPVLAYVDPITGQPNFTGGHTVRAARIEPVTPPGTVYGTREFAALVAAEGETALRCEPVGRVSLAKHAAVVPLFVVRRASGT